jgi:hypothetical protein
VTDCLLYTTVQYSITLLLYHSTALTALPSSPLSCSILLWSTGTAILLFLSSTGTGWPVTLLGTHGAIQISGDGRCQWLRSQCGPSTRFWVSGSGLRKAGEHGLEPSNHTISIIVISTMRLHWFLSAVVALHSAVGASTGKQRLSALTEPLSLSWKLCKRLLTQGKSWA